MTRMFIEEAEEIVRFALTGPLLQPRDGTQAELRGWLKVECIGEAFRLYFLPLDDPEEAERLKLQYQPDIVNAELGKLGVLGSDPYFDTALSMTRRVREAVGNRLANADPKLAPEIDGVLCAILKGRLVRAKGVDLFEQMFLALQFGYWPFGIIVRSKTQLIVYTGGLK